MPLILEGLVSTRNPDGSINLAPMGPIVERTEQEELRQLLFRPFVDSQTCQNLLRHPEGVFHLTDEVGLFARAVTGQLRPQELPWTPAKEISGARLFRCCSWYEFRVSECDWRQSPRLEMSAQVVLAGHERRWRGYNRAQFAVIEGAILMTRLHILEQTNVISRWQELKVLIEKTAGPEELAAFATLEEHLAQKQNSVLPTQASLAEGPGHE